EKLCALSTGALSIPPTSCCRASTHGCLVNQVETTQLPTVPWSLTISTRAAGLSSSSSCVVFGAAANHTLRPMPYLELIFSPSPVIGPAGTELAKYFDTRTVNGRVAGWIS